MKRFQPNRLFIGILLFFLIGILNQKVFSQELVSSSGNEFKNDQLQISWSMGEPVIETFEGSSTQLTQGFHQSNLVITTVEEIPGIDFMLTAFPNPVVNYLTLKTDYNQVNQLRYILYDSEGSMLLQADVLSDESEIPMHKYVPASYFLKIIKEDTPLKTFKIIKTQ
nr:T9SS type A sorting domain-containing protein [uncultured Draconibacterium sp.]